MRVSPVRLWPGPPPRSLRNRSRLRPRCLHHEVTKFGPYPSRGRIGPSGALAHHDVAFLRRSSTGAEVGEREVGLLLAHRVGVDAKCERGIADVLGHAGDGGTKPKHAAVA